MERIYAKSEHATRAREIVETLQKHFVDRLEEVAKKYGETESFEPISWVRDEGKHGGGCRYSIAETKIFNGGSVNVSGVHYDDQPERRLRSADALSTIIHPQHPLAPSVHIHISWTESKTGDKAGYWRVMADLNPSIEEPEATARFAEAIKEAAGSFYEKGEADGAQYFYIPALGRHRGVTHFYLEGHNTGDFEADTELARKVCKAAMDTYCEILDQALDGAGEATAEQKQQQLDYHTLYLFQVLTLDRGTTSGLLVHSQNDVGILGSIPCYVNRALLDSWKTKVPKPQDELVAGLVQALDEEMPSHVTPEVRKVLAITVRDHFRKYPDALNLQAKGSIVPPTVANHLEGGGGGTRS